MMELLSWTAAAYLLLPTSYTLDAHDTKKIEGADGRFSGGRPSRRACTDHTVSHSFAPGLSIRRQFHWCRDFVRG